jgi:D-sedoheptulose 7-phosphate isomerase
LEFARNHKRGQMTAAVSEPSQIFRDAIEAGIATTRSLATLEEPLQRAARLIEECLATRHKLLVCGNGGSAADAADFSTEFTCRFKHDRRPYPALNLALGGSLLSAIGNDYGFEEIFARQVVAFGERGDALVAITTSGKSRNIIRALEESKARGLTSVALLGRDGGSAKGMADVELIVPSDTTARIQEAHKFLLHVLCETVEAQLPR